MRTNQKSFFKAKPGRRTAISCSSDNTVYYSFTSRSRNPAGRVPEFILTGCVQGASPPFRCLDSTQTAQPIVNAFLTLSAVTKCEEPNRVGDGRGPVSRSKCHGY